MKRMKRLICRLRGHRDREEPYPSRWIEPWQYGDKLPFGIEDPLSWNLAWMRCERCGRTHWVFASDTAYAHYLAVLNRALYAGSGK